MTLSTRIPRFRSTKRLIYWLSANHYNLPKNEYHRVMRLPAESEQCFFKSKESTSKISSNLVAYAEMVGPLGEEFENLLFSAEGDNSNNLTRYVKAIYRYNASDKQNYPVAHRFYEALKGYDKSLLEIAQQTAYWDGTTQRFSRLPEDVENSFSDPSVSIVYAKQIMGCRWSQDMERKIFENTTPDLLVRYISTIAFFPEEGEWAMEHLKSSPEGLMSYAEYLRTKGKVLPEHLHTHLKGHTPQLFKLAQHLSKRLPAELEDTMSVPSILLDYAKHFVRGRLPLHLEEHLIKDHQVACRYAFEVIRGFSSPQLPDDLHSMMLMKSWEFPNDASIKKYIEACEGKC